MSRSGFFTDGIDYRLPHPPIDDAVLLIIHNAICRGLELLRGSGFALGTAHEDDITRRLHSILENRLRQKGEVPGFDERLFRKVWRAPEFSNFDGHHPAKKPDLVFDLVRDEMLVLSTHDALFVECKLVGKTHSVGTGYCNTGMFRFIEGDYGWAMQEGMMVAYARHGYTLAGSLARVLVSERYHTRLGQPTSLKSVPGCSVHPLAERVHVTAHRRNFQWPDKKGQAVGIRMFHSWHECS